MAGTGTVAHVGVYIEKTILAEYVSAIGTYIETKTDSIRYVSQIGTYIELNNDGTPIIVSTDGEQSSIFGLFR